MRLAVGRLTELLPQSRRALPAAAARSAPRPRASRAAPAGADHVLATLQHRWCDLREVLALLGLERSWSKPSARIAVNTPLSTVSSSRCASTSGRGVVLSFPAGVQVPPTPPSGRSRFRNRSTAVRGTRCITSRSSDGACSWRQAHVIRASTTASPDSEGVKKHACRKHRELFAPTLCRWNAQRIGVLLSMGGIVLMPGT